MTDTTLPPAEQCPHCGADADEFGNGKWFDCGSIVGSQSLLCEVRTLRAKVAARQELLDDIRNNLYVQTFDTCPPGYAGIINEGMLRRLGVKLSDT